MCGCARPEVPGRTAIAGVTGEQACLPFLSPTGSDILENAPQKSFEPTRWRLVLRARAEDTAHRRVALEELCRAYRYPLYAFLRRSRRGVEDAQDLAQEFFGRLLDGQLLEKADPARGKFRTLLLSGLKHPDADAYRAARAEKRGGRVEIVSLGSAHAEERWHADRSSELSPERAFDRAWADTVMDRASRQLKAGFAAADQAEIGRASCRERVLASV